MTQLIMNNMIMLSIIILLVSLELSFKVNCISQLVVLLNFLGKFELVKKCFSTWSFGYCQVISVFEMVQNVLAFDMTPLNYAY